MELRTEIEIDAPPERVWSALTAFSAYHTWNPFIDVEGQLEPGGALRVTVSPPESDATSFRATVLVCDEPHELRWRGRLWFPGLLEGEHFFRCLLTSDGRTRFVHGENFRGALLKFLGHRMQHVARGFVYMNQALKRYVETPESLAIRRDGARGID